MSGADGGSANQTPEAKQINDLRLTGRSNLAACHLKLNHFDKALKNANLALQQDPNNAKGL